MKKTNFMYKIEIKLRINNIPDKSFDLVDSVIKASGFQSTHMDILVNFSKPLVENQEYSYSKLFELMKNYPDSITLKNKTSYKNSLKKIEVKFVNVNKLELLQNVTLGFFAEHINNNLIDEFLKIIQKEEDFIYLLAYNFDDSFEQSDISLDIENCDNKLFNYGKNIKIKGYRFIAAPVMCFGNLYNEVIAFTLLLDLKDIFFVKLINEKVIYLELFDLYENPISDLNRLRQKKYWDFLELNHIINNFNKKTTFSFFEFLKNQK